MCDGDRKGGVVTGQDLFFYIRCAIAGDDLSTRLCLRVAMRPALSWQVHLEEQEQQSQEPSMPWVEGFLSRKAYDALRM